MAGIDEWNSAADASEQRAVRATETLPVVVDHGLSPLDMPVTTFQGALQRRGANRNSLIEWVRSRLVSGTDYGPIHVSKNCPNKYHCNNPDHYSKDSLRKPGAEKICGMLGVLVTFPALVEYEQAAIQGKEISSIMLRCHLLSPDGSKVVAEGSGARNVAQDFGDLNKALKMCMKSAQIDATLRMAGLSEIFTQDLEDAPDEPDQQPAASRPTNSPPSYSGDSQGSVFNTPPQQQAARTYADTQGTYAQQQAQQPLPGVPQQPTPPPQVSYATEAQRDYVQDVAVQVGISPSMLYDKFKVTRLSELRKNQIDDVLKWLRSYDIDDSAQIPHIGK